MRQYQDHPLHQFGVWQRKWHWPWQQGCCKMVWSIEEQNKLNSRSSTSIKIQIERTVNELHFLVEIDAFSNLLGYQVSYQPKKRYKVLLPSEKKFVSAKYHFSFLFGVFITVTFIKKQALRKVLWAAQINILKQIWNRFVYICNVKTGFLYCPTV